MTQTKCLEISLFIFWLFFSSATADEITFRDIESQITKEFEVVMNRPLAKGKSFHEQGANSEQRFLMRRNFYESDEGKHLIKLGLEWGLTNDTILFLIVEGMATSENETLKQRFIESVYKLIPRVRQDSYFHKGSLIFDSLPEGYRLTGFAVTEWKEKDLFAIQFIARKGLNQLIYVPRLGWSFVGKGEEVVRPVTEK